MSDGTYIVRRALRKLGADSVASEAPPEMIMDGMDTLNSLIQEWLTSTIDMGCVPLEAPGDELGEPMDARNGIIENLAVRMFPDVPSAQGVSLAELKKNANLSLIFIKKHYQNLTPPKAVPSSTMPMGAGNVRGLYEDVFAGSGREIDA